jgi:DNA-binding response OmpR family regulator
MRVLLVEFEQSLRGEIAARLERDGCTVRVAASAWDALAMLQEDPLPDMVAMDLGCPEGCGDWLVRECRADDRLARLSVLSPEETMHRAAVARRIARLAAVRPARLGAVLEHLGRAVWGKVQG